MVARSSATVESKPMPAKPRGWILSPPTLLQWMVSTSRMLVQRGASYCSTKTFRWLLQCYIPCVHSTPRMVTSTALPWDSRYSGHTTAHEWQQHLPHHTGVVKRPVTNKTIETRQLTNNTKDRWQNASHQIEKLALHIKTTKF
ncbi:hypothetical protein, unlikely [Trypanosoma congolense IL3000]|uniref:Uncharacterized protein n=1 Tax=Trypanosoma congolense (strain IL3000) TaxID=1068625 RepID=F9W574_TRYCI|nr:hypothetical protein, unlikely [Trypanosoma congolense IL3000]